MASAERRAFWAARLARLYPAYLLAFLLAAPFALERWAAGGPFASAKAAAVAAAALLLVQAWFPSIARLWNAPGWSTSVVLAFYAAFPFAAARFSRLSRRGLWVALGSAWALSLAAAIAIVGWGGAPYVLLHNGLLAPLFAVAIVGLAQGTGPLARVLGSAPARALGDASFALYALQEPLWLWARQLAGEPQAPASRAFVVAFLAAAIGIAVAVSRWLERPARRALRAALRGGPHPARAGPLPLARGEREA